jgi:hypothetical protein
MNRIYKKIELNDKFTKLTVLSFSHLDNRNRKWWNCVCDCGKKTTPHTGNLNSGNTKSCGCYVKEAAFNRRKSLYQTETTAIIIGYKRHALDRGLKWLLSRIEVESIIKEPCHYCGLPPSNIKITKNTLNTGLLYSGIDRVDSSLDYTIENVGSIKNV